MQNIKKYYKNVVQLVVLSFALLSLSGCATIAGDNTRTICVNSIPQGAGIYIDGQRYGTTPASLTLPNYIYGGKAMTIKKEGYYEQTSTITTKFQPCGLWNILFWPGFVIDGATGSTVKINPSQLNMALQLEEMKAESAKLEPVKIESAKQEPVKVENTK